MSSLYQIQNREHCNQVSLDYYYNHKEDRLIKARAWKDAHREYIREYNRSYRLANPERTAFHKSLHKDRKRNALGGHTFLEWQELKARYGFMCAMCMGKEGIVKLTKDHIEPISMGGNNDISNIQPLCPRCNSKKALKNRRFINPLIVRLTIGEKPDIYGATGRKEVPMNILREE